MSKDYYDTLDISKSATAEEVKQAYKKLAKSHHPDMVGDGDKKQAETRFKEINEAYQVLSDPQKRKMYDTYGHAGTGFNAGGGNNGFQGQWSSASGANPFGEGFEGFDPFDVFESIFGSRGFGGSRTPRRGKNLYYEMQIEFRDAVFGLEKEVNIESGKLSIKIPQGVHDGAEMRFPGKGMPGPQGTPAGDLFLTLHYKSPREFDISRENIFVTKDIDFVIATLGGTVDIPVVDLHSTSGISHTQLKIPAGTQPGMRFLVKGKGMPKLHATTQGDVLVQVNLAIPKKISKKQKQLLEEYLTA